MHTVTLLLLSTCLIFGQNAETSSPDAVFKEKTFLPAIVPLTVQKILEKNGEITITIEVLYSEESIISWIAHGFHSSYIDRTYLRDLDTVPSRYVLYVSIPREVVQTTRNDSQLDQGNDGQITEGVFTLDNEDFLVDYNELYIKFQTIDLSEAAVLKISLEVDKGDDEGDVNTEKVYEGNNTAVADVAVPKFPEMMKIDEDLIAVVAGKRSLILLDVLFTDNDRYSVRGLLYNSSSNRLFTTTWSTDYLLGQSDFIKINEGHDQVHIKFDDNVKLVDSFGSQQSSSVRQILIDIPTQNVDISGVYTIRAHHEASFKDEGCIIESSLEQVFRVQKTDQEHGPIPTGVLEFEGGTRSKITCHTGVECLLTCRVYGVGVQSLQLMHKDVAGQFVILPHEDVEYGSYESVVTVLANTRNPANTGTYICKADSGPVSISKEIDVDFLDK